MMATLMILDGGTLRVAGIDALRHPGQVRARIGLAGQYAAVEEAMSGIENLEMVARLFGFSKREARQQAGAVLERLDLVDAGDRLVRTWSGGMRRRLELGATLVGAPRVLLLDELTTGLDPGSRIGLWESVRELVNDGTDVVLTTQYLDEADHLADRIVIIDHGRTIAEGSPAELKAEGGRDVVEAHPRDRGQAGSVADVLAAAIGAPASIEHDTGRVSVPVADGTRGLAVAVRGLDEAGIVVDDLALRRPTLDEIFLALTGHGTDTAEPRSDRRHRRHPRADGGTVTITATIADTAAPTATPGRTGAGLITATRVVARRTLVHFQAHAAAARRGDRAGRDVLLIFRYVFGGAISGFHGVNYVDFLVPGYVVTGVLFSGMGAAAGVAEDVEQGVVDRLRSLPIRGSPWPVGRALGETALVMWGAAITTAIGFMVGFRPAGTIAGNVFAFVLVVVFGFAFTWMFMIIGLVSGSAQAAQGMSLLFFPLTFVSSVYVPGGDDAGLDAADRPQPADHRDGGRSPGMGARRSGHGPRPHDEVPDGAGPAVVSRPGRRLRPDRRGPLPLILDMTARNGSIGLVSTDGSPQPVQPAAGRSNHRWTWPVPMAFSYSL